MTCNTNTLSPWKPIQAIRKDFERQMGLSPRTFPYRLTVTEKDNHVSVSVDVPGLNEDAISVSIDDGHLLIEGDRNAPNSEDARVVYNERGFGKFRRVLKLDDSLDPESVDAVLENGVLTITLSRLPEVQPKKIDIRVAN